MAGFCVTESNYVNSQHIIYCNSYATFVSLSYTNTVTQPDSTTDSTIGPTGTASSGSTATNTRPSSKDGHTTITAIATTTATATATDKPAAKQAFSTGALVGIGIGGVAAISALLALLFWFLWRSRKGKYINPNTNSGRGSFPPAPYPGSAPYLGPAPYSGHIPFNSTAKYQPPGAPAEMASPSPPYQAYANYPSSGRQTPPLPGPESYLLPVKQNQQALQPNFQAFSQPPPSPSLRSDTLSPSTYSDNGYNDRGSATISELGGTSMSVGTGTQISRLSATGADGYVSAEDALRTGSVRG
ncbi:hypothetical protein FGG08_005879 [Glutinoglossum americanum]|uniref:Uncharacterized protein n=1 Tax=Glutinoglossum americanum TaxID=1670608 RepID=A0A9P8I6F7_9PEZI|nr:hypothetical protein FGG08_005879 [Glutinoglossum americanum]